MTNGQQFALSEFYPNLYTFQKADCSQQFRPESAPIISVTITGTCAQTAAVGTSACSAREVYRATSAVTATAATSAVSAREKYQATSATTATAATSAVAAREKYTATSGATASAGTSAAVCLEDDQGTCACTGSAGTCACAGSTSTGTTTVEQPVPVGGVVSKKTLEKFRKRYASIKGVAKLKPKRKARHKARGHQLIMALAETAEEPSQQTALALFVPLPVFAAIAELRSGALTSSARGSIRISGQGEIGPARPMIDDDDIAILLMLAA
jgi:hypothetical protein